MIYILLFGTEAFAQADSTKKLTELVVSGQLKAVRRSESIVPVELLSNNLFKKNPSPSLFESIGMVNGIQSQINCNVCNAGDIHINGMEGPYTMVLIDGMPIVSALSSVYGLSGIPNSIIERVEIVKGPASSLYGSEAMGGIINIITKNVSAAPRISVDIMGTSWGEITSDVSGKFALGKTKKIEGLIGINQHQYNNTIDNNKDGFTDIAVQNRWSVFNKWNLKRKNEKIASLATRYVRDERWGGQTNWNETFRGGDSIYGEQIATSRVELIGQYQWPTKERIFSQISYNLHKQKAFYGLNQFNAGQQVVFGQSYWDKDWSKQHNTLIGLSTRYTYYDDSSVGTPQPQKTLLPGLFAQYEWKKNAHFSLLTGYRLDYHPQHKLVHSPRLAAKWRLKNDQTLRLSAGTGFRVVNLFTEDHAALSGARTVLIRESLNPERSYNATLNYNRFIAAKSGPIEIDVTAFYTHFTNKIVGDYDSDPQKIIYQNMRGNALSRGLSLNIDKKFKLPLRLNIGISWMDVLLQTEDNSGDLITIRQLIAPQWSGNALLNYRFSKKWSFDLTAKYYGPMRLPILPNDYRPEYSPWFCLANVQVQNQTAQKLEIYAGIKNLFNFMPRNPIMRPFDPFDKQASDPISNPNGHTFDPSYNYASLQGIRGYLGIRYTL